ncbi:MAG TPA: purine-nucleoside phosphorylase [Cytophagales bacterium]|nr:purine-nucleoside phosphorylase [Cytophagales bacterium]
MLQKIKETAAFLADKKISNPETGIVLGTGLGQFADKIEVITSIDYKDIPHFPLATVEFHTGKLIFGKVGNKKVLTMQGRFHYYEGYSMQEIVFPIRVMKLLGIKHLLLSNASGGINLSFKKGDIIIIDDHINLLPSNPLVGKNIDELGPRFPDMSQPYSSRLNDLLEKVAKEQNLNLKKGVYVSVPGPNLETRAEYRFLKTIGADMVGMSTVPEVIAANHMGLPCAAVSVITDECDPDNLKAVSIQEIIATAKTADSKLASVFAETIVRL